MKPRIALASAAALLVCASSVPVAYAAPSDPGLDAETMRSAITMVKKVDIAPDHAVITVDGADPITLDWGKMVGGADNARTIGYVSGGALGLGLLGRLLRMLQMFTRLRGHT